MKISMTWFKRDTLPLFWRIVKCMCRLQFKHHFIAPLYATFLLMGLARFDDLNRDLADRAARISKEVRDIDVAIKALMGGKGLA